MCHLTQIDDLLTKKWLGHATLSMTKDVYTHFMKREKSPFTDYFVKLKRFEG
jgi:integrase